MSTIDYNVSCHVCFDVASINIYDATFRLNDADVELSSAFNQFSTLNSMKDPSSEASVLLCELCVDSLMKAYEFLDKVRKADEIYSDLHKDNGDIGTSAEIDDNYQENIVPNVEEVEEEEQIEEQEEEQIEEQEEEQIEEQEEYQQVEETVNEDDQITIPADESPEINKFVQKCTDHSVESQPKRKCVEVDKHFEIDWDNYDVKPEWVYLPQYNIVDYNRNGGAAEIDGSGRTCKTVNVVVHQYSINAMNDALNFAPPSSDASMYACKYCPKAFATPYHLITHIRKTHICQFCLQEFDNSVGLHNHVRATHKRHNCPFCNRQFTSYVALKTHLKRMHDLTLPPYVTLLDIRVN